ncbi:MAG: hypothetical protein HFI86_04690 [Bacilli bacterium]|nr:hypothetical protein [Bacilli bacterium]
MARVVKNKELINTSLATNYGGWIYCTNCNTNIGYLCYSTYDEINLNYKCNCGSNGSVFINFLDSNLGIENTDNLVVIKNRLCCLKDESPLLTLLDKKLINYKVSVTCRECHKIYHKEK